MQKADGKKISTKDIKTPMLVSSLHVTLEVEKGKNLAKVSKTFSLFL